MDRSSPDRSLRVIFASSKNTVRLASLAMVSCLASSTRATTVSGLTSRYRSLVATAIPVPDAAWPEVDEYLGRRNLRRKYKSANHLVEVQDWLLSDPRLPSSPGAEKEDTRAAVDFACQLGLLWTTSLQRTWRGSYLCDLSDRILDAVRAGDRNPNPFVLTAPQRLLLAWTSFTLDRTFTGYVLGLLRRLPPVFTFGEVAEAVRESLPAFASNIADLAASPADRIVVRRVQDLAGRLARTSGGRKARPGAVTEQTLRREFEELLFWRLEGLVDLRYLSKPDRHAFNYQMSPTVEGLTDLLGPDSDAGLHSSFFSQWRARTGQRSLRLQGDAALEALRRANEVRSNQMGYTLIEEGVLVANVLLCDDSLSRVLEWNDAMAAIADVDITKYKLLTSVDKDRRLSAFKLTVRA